MAKEGITELEEDTALVLEDPNEPLTNEQRLGVVYSAAVAYNICDDVFTLVVSLIGTIATVVFAIINTDCVAPTYLPSLGVLLLRFVEALVNCCVLFPGPPTHEKFGRFVVRNLVISVLQLVLAGVQIAFGLSLLEDSACLISGIISLAFGGVYLILGGIELMFWILGYFFWQSGKEQPIPYWIDDYLPETFKTYLKRGTDGLRDQQIAQTAMQA